MGIEERLKEYFEETGFDAVEIYYNKEDDTWTCCIMTGSQGEDKQDIEGAVISAIVEGK